MRTLVCAFLVVATLAVPRTVHADFAASGAVAVQLTRESQPGNEANGSPNLDETFVRAETNLRAETENGLSGLIHLRFQALMDSKPAVDAQVRQAYFRLPVAMLTVQAGRWYEVYTPGAYFGRYLFGVSDKGSGSMCVNYTILDGLRMTVPLMEKYKSQLHVALLPGTSTFESVYAMILATAQPLDFLQLRLGANLQAVQPGGEDPQHRAIIAATYQIVEDFDLFAEYGVTDLEHVRDASWILAGVDIPTAGILDVLRCEVEYHKDRLGPDTDGDLAVMAILCKTVAGLRFDLDVGSDPKGLGSEKLRHVGGYLRVTAKF